MKKSKLKGKILRDFENLIALSCSNFTESEKYQQLHVALLKKYYNAADVAIDYRRHRVMMDVVTDNGSFAAGRINTFLPLMPMNLSFDNLCGFLNSCITKDEKSIGFYAQLMKNIHCEQPAVAIA